METRRDLELCRRIWYIAGVRSAVALVSRFTCLLAFALASAFAPPARAEHPLARRYLDGLFRAKPHLATFMGDHRFDGRLADLSPAALAAREKELDALTAALERTPSSEMPSLDDRIDAEILAGGIALERLYLREIRDWEWDPRLDDSFPYYDPREVVAGRLSDIIHGDFAPEATRRRSVEAQLEALPRYLAQCTAALRTGRRHPPREYVEQAQKTNVGRIDFFETEVAAFVKPAPRAEAARRRAVQALRAFQSFLTDELPKRADGDWRLGEALYRRKFPLALQTDLLPAEVVPRAEAAFRAARAELSAVAQRLHRQLWPKEALAADPAKVIARVEERLSRDHPRADDLVAAHARNLDQLRAFITEHDLLGLPPRETLLVEPMPLFKRGSAAAEYLAPGVLDHHAAAWHATYYVDPVDPAWPPAKVESYLRGQNDYEVQLTAAHEAYPGHHTQYAYSKRNLNPLRAVLWNAAMVEGWAVYGEGMMVGLGWGGAQNDRFRFFDLRGQMIVATNILLDIQLQSGRMSDAEALRFMEVEGFQEPAMAEKKLLRAKLDSTQLAQYFLGCQEIKALELDYRKRVGARYSQRELNEALIGHGSIAVKFLRRYVLDAGTPAP
jgi:uncharacterized protein (DUF885 family)